MLCFYGQCFFSKKRVIGKKHGGFVNCLNHGSFELVHLEEGLTVGKKTTKRAIQQLTSD